MRPEGLNQKLAQTQTHLHTHTNTYARSENLIPAPLHLRL